MMASVAKWEKSPELQTVLTVLNIIFDVPKGKSPKLKAESSRVAERRLTNTRQDSGLRAERLFKAVAHLLHGESRGRTLPLTGAPRVAAATGSHC